MKKKIIALICVAILVFATVFACISALASDIDWYYDSQTSTLYISGDGAMDDYVQTYSAPWSTYTRDMQNLVIEEGVTYLGDYAFSGATSLTNVTVADSVTGMGNGVFAATPQLLSLSLGSNIAHIGDVSFAKDGEADKAGFVLTAEAGSYALHVAVSNNVAFSCESVSSGEHNVDIKQGTAMKAYLPYTAQVDGTFVFYSVSMEDTVGYVYDSSFNLIASNDDHGSTFYSGMSGCDFYISVNLSEGETYYFATKIYSPASAANYNVYIKAISYDVTGNIRALLNPDGTMSQNVLSGATINGTPTDGTFSLSVSGADYSAVFSCEGVNYTYVFNPDLGESVDVAMVMCDRNSDGIVNAKDFASMKRANSQYLQYYGNFINYTY